jgi:hypothetical protein
MLLEKNFLLKSFAIYIYIYIYRLLLTKFHYGDQLEADDMGTACSTHRLEKHVGFQWESMKKRIHWEGLNLSETMILNICARNRMERCELDLSGLAWIQWQLLCTW